MANIDANRFANPEGWWYRVEATLPPPLGGSGTAGGGGHLQLQFKGINYRANIYVNGGLVSSSDQARGAFRYFDFDVTKFASAGSDRLAIAVQVFRPYVNSFSLSFLSDCCRFRS
jgi:exo-1,4-beta-D-glucosaminidase